MRSVSTRLVGLVVQVAFVWPCIAIYRTDIFADAGHDFYCVSAPQAVARVFIFALFLYKYKRP